MKPELVIDSGCTIGEGPVWDERTGRLYFIDILGRRLYRWDGREITGTIDFQQSLGFAVPREGGGVVAGLEDGFYFADFDGTAPRKIADPEPGRTDGRLNDGKVDPAGRVWGGTMPVSLDTGEGEAGPDSGLYCLDGELRVKTMLRGVIQGNGMDWSAGGGKFYFIDTQRFCVQEFDYNLKENRLSGGRVCVEVPRDLGIPDGMTVDCEGMLWVALWGGGAVGRWDPASGRLLERVELPAKNVTSCCFGGAELDELYITTARLGTDLAQYPHAGGVFRVRPGVKGKASVRFRG